MSISFRRKFGSQQPGAMALAEHLRTKFFKTTLISVCLLICSWIGLEQLELSPLFVREEKSTYFQFLNDVFGGIPHAEGKLNIQNISRYYQMTGDGKVTWRPRNVTTDYRGLGDIARHWNTQNISTYHRVMDAEGVYWRPHNVSEYHYELLRCTKPGMSKMFNFEEMRARVKSTLSFDKVEWMPSYRNPCQNVTLDDKTGDLTPKHKACRDLPAASTLAPLYCLPYIYLAGVQKSGTTDLYANLVQHQYIIRAATKEPDFWTHKLLAYQKKSSLKEYLNNFSESSKCLQAIAANGDHHPAVTIDGSPSTLWNLNHWMLYPGNYLSSEPQITAADIIHDVTPQAKIVAIVRNPVDRLYSHYYHKCRALSDPARCSKHHFGEAVVSLVDMMTRCTAGRGLRECVYDTCLHWKGDHRIVTLRAGIYHLFLEDWLNVFPRNQLYVVHHESYSANRTKELNLLFKFIGVGSLSEEAMTAMSITPKNSRRSIYSEEGDMLSSTRELLQTFYRPHNQRLSDLLKDKRFLWKDYSPSADKPLSL